jgi:hypothetical protein
MLTSQLKRDVMVILLRRTLSIFYQAGRILDRMVTAGSLDKAYAGVLATQAQSRARAAQDEAVDRELAHPA